MRIIDPNDYKSYEHMMLEVCEGCKYNVLMHVSSLECSERSKICYPCYGDMKKKFGNGKTFEIDW